MTSAVFYRQLKKALSTITHGEGVHLYDTEGRRYLDAVGGAAVVAIGHGVREITDAVARHGAEIAYAYGATFTHPWQEQLARSLLTLVPGMAGVYFVSGGSEANETAVKMARQYFLHRGRPTKHKIVARSQSFHGVTLGTLALSGRTSWKTPFDPYLMAVPRVVPPYCYRCPVGQRHPTCNTACAEDLERVILQEGPETVAAFIAEPISGTSMTGAVPVDDYYARIRAICDRHDVLFIADEVLCGYGRTGSPLALQHWGIVPDIATMGKAIGSGYAPLGAVLASDRVMDAYRSGSGEFTHGFTFSGHPLSCFIGLQVFRHIERHGLFERAARMGAYLHERLASLADRHPIIGNVRGRGLLAGIEFVADRDTRTPLPAAAQVTSRVVDGAFGRGVIVLPGTPGVDHGRGGDHIQISPPYVITAEEIDEVVDVLDRSIGAVESTL